MLAEVGKISVVGQFTIFVVRTPTAVVYWAPFCVNTRNKSEICQIFLSFFAYSLVFHLQVDRIEREHARSFRIALCVWCPVVAFCLVGCSNHIKLCRSNVKSIVIQIHTDKERSDTHIYRVAVFAYCKFLCQSAFLVSFSQAPTVSVDIRPTSFIIVFSKN